MEMSKSEMYLKPDFEFKENIQNNYNNQFCCCSNRQKMKRKSDMHIEMIGKIQPEKGELLQFIERLEAVTQRVVIYLTQKVTVDAIDSNYR
jgi:hypothetical protein